MRRKGIKIFLYAFMCLFFLGILTGSRLSGAWADHARRISGSPAPVINVRPYTIMTQEAGGLWRYSCYYIPGQSVTFKFMVNTNAVNTNFFYELREPREITVSFGTQGKTYYLTNTPAGLAKVTEGTGANRFMELEFNWEDDPDPPTGLYAENIVPGGCALRWYRSFELDVRGYNIYASNQFYPYYRKMNAGPVTTNCFVLTNLISGSTNSLYVTSLDAYTNMPNSESPPSSLIRVIADETVPVLFYLKKRRDEVPDSVYLCGDRAPLDWNFSQKMQYLYNDIWYTRGFFIRNTALQYKYNVDKSVSGYEEPFSTSSGNREVLLADPDGDGMVILNDTWGIRSNSNPPPAPVANSRAVPGNASVFLFWDANSEADFKEYRIYRSRMNTNQFRLAANRVSTNWLDTGVVNDTNYYYRLTAVDQSGAESSFSPMLSALPSTNPRPVSPFGLRALPADRTNALSWSKNPEADIQGYVVWRSLQKYSVYSNVSGLVLTNMFIDRPLTNGTVYYYKLQAVDTAGQTNSGFSAIVSAVPGSDPAPVKVENLEVTLTARNSISLAWRAGPEKDLTGYAVYCKKEDGVTAWTNLPLSTSVTLSGLSTGSRYSLWVRAVDTRTNGESSDILIAYPVPEIMDLAARPSGTESGAVSLDFTSPEKAGSLGYPVRYIIKYSKTPVRDFREFYQASFFSEKSASLSGSAEQAKVNGLGADCPGFYFTVMAIYGNEDARSISESQYRVAGQVFSPGLGGVVRKAGTRMQVVIPPSGLPEESSAVVIRTREDMVKEKSGRLPVLIAANEKAAAYPLVRLVQGNTNNIYDVSIIHSGGEEISGKDRFPGKVYLYLPFEDAEHDLVVDGTGGSVRAENLRMFWLNERTASWALIEDSSVDFVNNLVRAGTDHFTVFSFMALSPAGDLKNMAVYPNPAYSPSAANRIVFTKLTATARIRIYTVSGELVKKGLAADSTGKCFWDGMNESGKPVSSGLYIYYAEDGLHEPARGKLSIIR